jgi:hypothetical protein
VSLLAGVPGHGLHRRDARAEVAVDLDDETEKLAKLEAKVLATFGTAGAALVEEVKRSS